MNVKTVLLTSVFLALLMPAILVSSTRADEPEYDPDAVLGLWETAHDDSSWSHVEIYMKDDKYCGKIVWLSLPNYPADDPEGMAGQPKVDRKNPDETLRDHPILGLE